MKTCNYLGIILATFLLFGCGGDDSSSDGQTSPDQTTDNGSQQSTSETIYGLDSTNRAVVGTPVTYDLDINYSDDSKAVITGLPKIAYGDCSIESSTSSSFTVYPKSVGECRIDYNIASTASLRSSESDTNAGMLRLAVSKSLINDNELPRRSVAMFSEDGVTTVDLTSLLGSDWPTGTFELDNVNALQVMGVSATATQINGTTIEITPASSNQGGVTRILYSLTDQTTTKLGTIDVAVSVGDGVNHAPVVQDFFFEPEDGSLIVTIGKTYTVNIPAGYITDPDNTPSNPNEDTLVVQWGDPIYSYQEIPVADPTPIPLTASAYSYGGYTTQPYIVSDGKGGLSIGHIHYYAPLNMTQINQSWLDLDLAATDTDGNTVITDGDPAYITFTRPLVKLSADNLLIPYNSTHKITWEEHRIDRKGTAFSEIILSDYETAEQHCSKLQARLPTPKEIQRIVNTVDGSNLYDAIQPNGSTVSWPTTHSYWTSNKTSADTAQAWDFYTGTSIPNNSVNDHLIVTCTKLDSNFGVYNFNVEMTPVPAQSEQGRIRMKAVAVDPHGGIAPYQDVTLEVKYGEIDSTDRANESIHPKNKKFTANSNGEIYFDYYELNALTDDTIVAKQANVVIGTYAYAAGNTGYGSVMRNLDIHYTSMLSQSSSSGANAAVSYYNGVTLWHNRSGARFANIYKEDFLGKNFSVYMAMTRPDALSNTGVINLALQQHTSPFTGTPNTGTNAFPGLTTGNKNLAINFTLTNGNSLKYTVTNGRDSVIAAPNTNSGGLLANTTLHFWVDYNNTTKQMKIYAAEADVKPTNATVTVDNVTWGDIDPSAPYWIQVSSYSNQNTSAAANLTTLKFNSWD